MRISLSLAAPFALRSEEKVRATCMSMVLAPCALRSRAEVIKSCAKNAHHIESAVLEKALVFRGEHRIRP